MLWGLNKNARDCKWLFLPDIWSISRLKPIEKRNKNMVKIRKVNQEDANKLCEIYDYYVKNTAITFEYETPTLNEFKDRIRKISRRYPYLVAEEKGVIVGYAYADSFIDRRAYDWSCETSIYVDKNYVGKGIGKTLYEALENELRKIGIINLYACVATIDNADEYLSNNSEAFHEHVGYKKIGTFSKCGYKFDRWYDMIFMEKTIGERTIPPKKVTLNFKNANKS